MSSTTCAGICADSAERPPASTPFEKVLDGRKQPIRGLWRRGQTFYARLSCETPEGNSIEKRIPLQAVTVAEAKLAMEQLRFQKAAGILTVKRSTPLFTDYTTTYLANARLTKRPNTVKLHTWVLRDAARLMGEIRLHQINEATLNRLRAKKLAEGCSPRTANVVVGAVVCVLHYAVTENLIKTVPNSKKLRETPKRKRLVTLPEIQALCETALKRLLNGRQFADYLTLLAFSGLRCSEALQLRWEDISFERQQLTVGAATVTKNGECRVVDFNNHLQSHLEEMRTRQTPDSCWLFPNASLNGKQPIKSFHCHMKRLKKAMKIEEFGFHHLRHFYASMCLMSGADFGTVSAWLGHKDNGALLARTYSHLADEHRKLMAAKVVFEPVIQTATDRLQLQAA